MSAVHRDCLFKWALRMLRNVAKTANLAKMRAFLECITTMQYILIYKSDHENMTDHESVVMGSNPVVA